MTAPPIRMGTGLDFRMKGLNGLVLQNKYTVTPLTVFFLSFLGLRSLLSVRTGDLILISLQPIHCGPRGLIQAGGLDGVIMEWE